MIRVEATLEHQGEQRVYRQEFDVTADEENLSAVSSSWFEGNYSCDCNRRDFWHRAAGERDPAASACGDGAFALVRLVVNGRVEEDYTR
jgi:hypothetical protein